MDASTPAGRRTRLIGTACAVSVMLLWTGFVLSARYGVSAGTGVRLAPLDLAALRFAVSGLAAAALWSMGIGRGLPLRRGFVLAGFAGLGFGLPAYIGFSLAPAAHGAVLLSGTLPFLVAIGTWWVFGERWSRARAISLALVLAGLLLLGAESYGAERAPPGAWRGDLLFLAASSSWAVYTVLARRWNVGPAQSVVAVGIGCAGVFLPVWWAAVPHAIHAVPWPELLFQGVYQGLLATGVSLFLYTTALARIGVARLTTITALTPGMAGVLAVPVLHEPIGPLALMGLALVCTAVAVGVRTPAAPRAA